jgi:tRNA-splicing ligase RtcB
MPVKQTLEGGRVPVKIWTDDIDAATQQQLRNVAQLPIVHGHIAAMPDVHLGKGATVGSVIATKKAIVPAAVGVDIGCGMCAACTTLTAEDLDEKTLKKVFDQISRDVPLGFEQHSDERRPDDAAQPLAAGLTRVTQKHPNVMKKAGKHSHWVNQLGSLGGGNHFIEICLDESGRVWVMLHSGSRGIGNAIGTYFIELARKDMERQDAQLPDRDLAYLTEGTEHFDDYVEAVGWAQDYARQNREVMLRLVLKALQRHTRPFEVVTQAIQCHHNYVERERHFGEDVWVTRKGAIRAGKGELGIIPGSMGARSYIVRGKGSPDSFESSAHGAGRRMSRNAAAKQFTEKDLAEQTVGIVCRKDRGVVDEIPSAYKPIDQVMANQDDLVEVVHTLKQVLCVKG